VTFCALLAWQALPLEARPTMTDAAPFRQVLWSDRALDVLIQLVLIFTGVLCVLGLLKETTAAATGNTLQEVQAAASRSSNGRRPAEPVAAEHTGVEEQA
jgi:hypothetical protein